MRRLSRLLEKLFWLETEEERVLKEEIDRLKKELAEELQESRADEASIANLIQIREKELEALIRELDAKVRFAQKVVERHGSGAGRFGSFSDRPPFQSGSIDDGRSLDFSDIPYSRGNPDIWTRPAEHRRGSFQGSRDRGFRGSRDFDRFCIKLSLHQFCMISTTMMLTRNSSLNCFPSVHRSVFRRHVKKKSTKTTKPCKKEHYSS